MPCADQNATPGADRGQADFEVEAPPNRLARLFAVSYRGLLAELLREHITPGRRVLELGCGAGDVLARLNPGLGVGVDYRPAQIVRARRRHPGIEFREGWIETFEDEREFDFILCSDTLGLLHDIQPVLEHVRRLAGTETRLVLTFHNFVWAPILRLAEWLRLKSVQPELNWLGGEDVLNLLYLSGYETEAIESHLLMPIRIPGVSAAINSLVRVVPGLSALALVHVVVARPKSSAPGAARSVSVVIPCRNERENIEPAIRRMPQFGSRQEIIFVDGASTDGTYEKIQEVIRANPDQNIRLVPQVPDHDYTAAAADGPPRVQMMLPAGKGDAVRKGFAAAAGDILMILDADLTVAPEDLPRFYRAVIDGKGDLVIGSRLVYPVQDQAMRFLNLVGNKVFSWVFTWLLSQRIKDTLCGTKVLTQSAYRRILSHRGHFGDFDPFGDFDLLFGAAHAGLRITEIPVRYHARTSGETKVRPIHHGLMLLRMAVIGLVRIKLARWIPSPG